MMGIGEVKGHPWFAEFDWQSLNDKTMKSPFQINLERENFDFNHVNNKAWNDTEIVDKSSEILRRESQKVIF